jgi:osmotically-inducible protein OsmY
MSRIPTFLLGAATGATAAYFLDADRRSAVTGKAGAAASSGAATVASNARYAAGKAKGAASSVTPSPTRLEDADDVTLARKVETEIFREPDVPKGDVSVDVQDGIAHLRGEVDDEWSDRLAADARGVEGIKGVENLLHPPGTPAPDASQR